MREKTVKAVVLMAIHAVAGASESSLVKISPKVRCNS